MTLWCDGQFPLFSAQGGDRSHLPRKLSLAQWFNHVDIKQGANRRPRHGDPEPKHDRLRSIPPRTDRVVQQKGRDQDRANAMHRAPCLVFVGKLRAPDC